MSSSDEKSVSFVGKAPQISAVTPMQAEWGQNAVTIEHSRAAMLAMSGTMPEGLVCSSNTPESISKRKWTSIKKNLINEKKGNH